MGVSQNCGVDETVANLIMINRTGVIKHLKTDIISVLFMLW